jgi:uncharacterized membrane protein YgdD (TMEM256/DUF423 family)
MSWVACGALLGALSVAAGAFGAHVIGDRIRKDTSLTDEERSAQRNLDIFEIAAKYQMYHALAIVLTGLLATRFTSAWFTVAEVCFLLGVAVFCGCLYAMALGGPRILGAVVPIGGLAFILGWISLVVAALRATGAEQAMNR